MKFWQSVSFTEPEQLVEIARLCESCGFEGILVSDHLFFPEKLGSKYPYTPDGVPGFTPETPWPEPFSSVAAMAAVTRKLRFATMVYILPLRHPLVVAKACATLDVISNGRFALGAGAGWMKEEFDQLGVDFQTRGARFDESIQVVRKLWSGRVTEHHGRFFDFPRLSMSPKAERDVPIWIGGESKAALRRAAQCDGWLGSGNDPGTALRILDELRQLRRAAGRERERFESIVPLTTAPDPDTLKRLRDRGADGTVSYPFTYTVGTPTSTLAQKRAYLEGFAENVIRHVR
jgi:probable F420-dependent oxidoreductase